MGMRKIRDKVNMGAALLSSAAVLWVCARGVGPLPALGPVLNPGTGVWTSATDATSPKTQTLQIHGLNKPVEIHFDTKGVAYIDAQTNHDLFLAMGYLHAKNRLFQMDLMRRQGEGRLSQVVGAQALSSDKFELQLGLLRTAQQEWSQMPANDPARKALKAYSRGVNDVIAKDERTGHLPMLFKLLGYTPKQWTPIDSLVIQGDMTQTLDFTTGPLQYALLEKSLGAKRTMDWFPVIPKDTQHPYDTGPYESGGNAPIENEQENLLPGSQVTASTAQAAAAFIKRIRDLPASAIHRGSNSNNWAVDGTKTASGAAMIAGDPHLSQTLPAIWYQLTAKSPSYSFSGVSIPGIPMILIGRNPQISWSLTNVQNQATFYYKEETNQQHPDEYYWKGQWRKMKHVKYTIPVKGAKSVPLDVKLTIHGPIMTQGGQTLAVDWVGDLPSPDLDVMLNIIKSRNFEDFRSALKSWKAPSQNFVYADKQGNIGMISAGYYPLIKSGQPWLPLPGTGQSDIIGTIPYADIPQTYNPPSHFVFSANQREVGSKYSYYIGTTMDFFAAGYRADEIYETLNHASDLQIKDFENLQNNVTDYLATEIIPKLKQALSTTHLNVKQTQARDLLVNWNDKMTANSAAASIWWQFWVQYMQDTFGPWWKAKSVPVNVDRRLQVGPNQTALDEDLEAWTLHDGNNPAFSLPDGTKRNSTQVMVKAFKGAVTQLTKNYGNQPATWKWGVQHFREFPSLAQIPSLGYGPREAGGDLWTVDAADGGMLSTAGPSWRMIVNFGTKNEGVYPGGQSENPVSPWYDNLVEAWWNGRYYPMHLNTQNVANVTATWTLQP